VRKFDSFDIQIFKIIDLSLDLFFLEFCWIMILWIRGLWGRILILGQKYFENWVEIVLVWMILNFNIYWIIEIILENLLKIIKYFYCLIFYWNLCTVYWEFDNYFISFLLLNLLFLQINNFFNLILLIIKFISFNLIWIHVSKVILLKINLKYYCLLNFSKILKFC
jgi:hypothetical protein